MTLLLWNHYSWFLSNLFLKIRWDVKKELPQKIIGSLKSLHENNVVHCGLHSRNILMKNRDPYFLYVIINPGLCRLRIDSISKKKKIYGSISYIPPEVLRGNYFIREGDIYSLGGIIDIKFDSNSFKRPTINELAFRNYIHNGFLDADDLEK
ncbi:hypothetical protein Glove_229g93 [Diversispora epigaea]|uniref:Protein kinase domain-containing protein n=1 Tax=Diversispora epigaea TaxID=1348612 RepID=A0A397ID24_9GLOM|nr:hypothetical protein Glove_229g93 [Diversispora epigaea]